MIKNIKSIPPFCILFTNNLHCKIIKTFTIWPLTQYVIKVIQLWWTILI